MRDEQGGAGATGEYGGIGGSASSGHPAGEVLFLDEPEDYARRARVPERPSAREFFADEEVIAAGGAPAVAAATPALRFNLLTMSLLVVATAAFATAQSCQADAMSPGSHAAAAPSGPGAASRLP